MSRRAGFGLALVLLLVAGGALWWRTFAPVAPASGECQPSPLYTTRIAPVLGANGMYRPPCSAFRFQSAEFDREVHLNSLGLHMPELSLPKPSGVYRLLVIGDSFPQALQVAPEQAFPQLTAALLTAQSGRSLEVVNLSMDAFGTDRELLLYALAGASLQPDAVLLTVYVGNDVQDNSVDLEARRYGYPLQRPFFSLSAAGVLRLHTDSAAAYQGSWAFPIFPAPTVDPPDHPAVLSREPYQLEYPVELGLYLPEDRQWTAAWALTEALLLRFREQTAQAGLPFAVLLIPDRRAVHDGDWSATLAQYAPLLPALHSADPAAPARRLQTFLEGQGIPVLNLTGALSARARSRPDERLYFAQDGHFTPEGHRAAAERLSSWLLACCLFGASGG